MHTYNPLTLPDTISKIIQDQSLEELEKNCWINHTWYNEIKRELRKRWNIQVMKYAAIEYEKNDALENIDKSFLTQESIDMISKIIAKGYLKKYYIAKQFETFEKQVEIEKSMLLNGMLDEQEKEIVKYNICQGLYKVDPFELDFDWKQRIH